jgi:hypothetical protein
MENTANQFVMFRTFGGVHQKGFLTVLQPPEPFTVPKIIFSEHKLTAQEIDEAFDWSETWQQVMWDDVSWFRGAAVLLRKQLAKLELSDQVVDSIEKTIREDGILPMLDLENPDISTDIVGDEVFVSIGPRDWQWDKHTGACIGSGTYLD